MGVADIPTKLGADFLIRTLLPGLIAFFVFFEPIIHPLIRDTWETLVFGDKILVSLFFGLALGLIFILCDLYIYQLFEGVKFWPDYLWKWKFNRMEKYYQKLDGELRSLSRKMKKISTMPNSRESIKLDLEIRKLSDKMREFPPDLKRKGWYPLCPTRLGNVIFEYETYSQNRYGINMVVFWDHLTQILPKETKEELKLKCAMADFCVYLSFTSLIYVFVGPVALLFQEESWITIWSYPIPAESLFHLFFSIIIFRSLYELSIIQHRNYGSFVKSTFDLFRLKLARNLGIEIKKRYHSSKDELEEEQALWEKYMNYYLHYTFVD